MKCPRGHSRIQFYPGDTFDELYCETCDITYWFAPNRGWNRLDEIDPCDCGVHEWKTIYYDGEDIGSECTRCGLIDM